MYNKLLIAALTAQILLVGSISSAQRASGSLNNLGNQENLLDKAQPTVPANTYRVVQKRVIDRDLRAEFNLNAGLNTSGGDSYYRTKSLGAQLEFHITPRWSVGVRQNYFFNELTAEGKIAFETSEAALKVNKGDSASVPVIDYPLEQTLASVSFYPLYGKMSWFDSNVSYFDFYMMLGGGQMKLRYGTTPVATGGVGLGMWWTQHLSSRIELRYQKYQDQLNMKEARDIDNTTAIFAMGFLL
jgi:outer membrane immunogenic protein